MSNLIQTLEARRLPAASVRRAIRVGAGATQQDIADELGVHRMTIARWESGAHLPRQNAAAEAYARLLSDLYALRPREEQLDAAEPAAI